LFPADTFQFDPPGARIGERLTQLARLLRGPEVMNVRRSNPGILATLERSDPLQTYTYQTLVFIA